MYPFSTVSYPVQPDPVVRRIPAIVPGMGWWESTKALIFNDDKWELVQDYHFIAKLSDGTYLDLFAPAGFIWDGASIPKAFRMFIHPAGALFVPSIFHDMGYRYQYLYNFRKEKICTDYKRQQFDKMFHDIGVQVTNLRVTPDACYAALRTFGWISWNKHRKKYAGTK